MLVDQPPVLQPPLKPPDQSLPTHLRRATIEEHLEEPRNLCRTQSEQGNLYGTQLPVFVEESNLELKSCSTSPSPSTPTRVLSSCPTKFSLSSPTKQLIPKSPPAQPKSRLDLKPQDKISCSLFVSTSLLSLPKPNHHTESSHRPYSTDSKLHNCAPTHNLAPCDDVDYEVPPKPPDDISPRPPNTSISSVAGFMCCGIRESKKYRNSGFSDAAHHLFVKIPPLDIPTIYWYSADFQTIGGYHNNNGYANQAPVWNNSSYSSGVAATSVQYQQQYTQCADYYNQTQVSCAPVTENLSVPSSSTLGCPISAATSSYATLQALVRYAVVTRSNKGIGFEIVKQLAEARIKVVLTARDEQRGLQALETLKASGLSDSVVFHQLDVADAASVAALAYFVKSQFGKLDILVNNAGIGGVEIKDSNLFSSALNTNGLALSNDELRSSMTQTYVSTKECLQINYHGAKTTFEYLLPLLQLSDSPRVVNVSVALGKIEHLSNEWAKGIYQKLCFNYGDGVSAHYCWAHAEDMTTSRISCKIDEQHPFVVSLFSGWITDKADRRRSFQLCVFLMIMGALISATTNSSWGIILGRLFFGTGMRLGPPIAALYVAEVSPTIMRVALGGLTQNVKCLSLMENNYVATCNLFELVFSMILMDKLGRKVLLLGSLLGMTVTMGIQFYKSVKSLLQALMHLEKCIFLVACCCTVSAIIFSFALLFIVLLRFLVLAWNEIVSYI
ncbi:uncharacterized protein LOC131633521 [Vicia villosa]|uniref:uncharacterized protein LOC131633521 n=1 Tax=Vicia villosa TaxID=3911 RepID=UPI00273AD1C5|nr:uncharacterized protein LOC131633521 [Vicia villosa]